MVTIIYGTKLPNVVYDNILKNDQFNKLITYINDKFNVNFYMNRIGEKSYVGFKFDKIEKNTVIEIMSDKMNDFTDTLENPFNKLFTPIMEIWNQEIIKANKKLEKDFKEGMNMDDMIKEHFPDLIVGDSLVMKWLIINSKV